MRSVDITYHASAHVSAAHCECAAARWAVAGLYKNHDPTIRSSSLGAEEFPAHRCGHAAPFLRTGGRFCGLCLHDGHHQNCGNCVSKFFHRAVPFTSTPKEDTGLLRDCFYLPAAECNMNGSLQNVHIGGRWLSWFRIAQGCEDGIVGFHLGDRFV